MYFGFGGGFEGRLERVGEGLGRGWGRAGEGVWGGAGEGLAKGWGELGFLYSRLALQANSSLYKNEPFFKGLHKMKPPRGTPPNHCFPE